MSKPSTLAQAPKHVQLAVDLIQLLEENQIEPKLVLEALAIVEQDYKNKLSDLSQSRPGKE